MNASRQNQSKAPGATSVQSLLPRYAFTIAYNHWLRWSRFSPDQKVAAMAAAGALLWPLGVLRGCAGLWWLLTGRRAPGRLGHWLGGPPLAIVNPFVKPLPADYAAAARRVRAAASRRHDPNH
jgi:hypothetical protein